MIGLYLKNPDNEYFVPAPGVLLRSQNRFWKLHDLTFEKESGYVCLFKLKISSRVQTEVTVNDNMITNVYIAIPHGDFYAILDMEWKELDSNKKFVYAYK